MIRLHHLSFSRSTRIIWLLEELGVPYDLVIHERTPDLRAPATLKAEHSLGKAPLIEDNGLLLAESGAIIEYITTAHGDGRLAPAPGTAQHVKWLEWLQYAEGSAAMPILTLLIGDRAGLTDSMRGFLAPAAGANLAFIANAVGEGGYLLDEFSSADIQMSYIVHMAIMAGLLDEYPAVADYLRRIESRPAFARALHVGGPVALPIG